MDDSYRAGYVQSMARPKGNTTGISFLTTDLNGKRQDILIEAVPGLRRLAALADNNPIPSAKFEAPQEVARA
jgi:putative tryptophan/tyrosine transport system substrate-binding protein